MTLKQIALILAFILLIGLFVLRALGGNPIGYTVKAVSAQSNPDDENRVFVPFFSKQTEGAQDDDGGMRPTSTPMPSQPSRCQTWQEAESAELSGLFKVTDDNGAVHIPAGYEFGNANAVQQDYVEFCFTVSQNGTYHLGGVVNGPSGTSNSFYVSVNGSPLENIVWHTNTQGQFIQEYVTHDDSNDAYGVWLDAGTHTVRLHRREADTRLDSLFIELAGSEPAPTPTPTSTPASLAPVETGLPTSADYVLTPGNLNSQWPKLQAGDVVFLDPGNYTGGNIDLTAEGSAGNPIKILKTPGKSGKVVIDGGSSQNHLFDITGAHIEIGGTQIGAGWEPDFVIQNYSFAGIRMRSSANDIRIHHIHFLDIGTSTGGSNGFAVRANGQNVVFEFNRIEDPAADVLQMESGTNLYNWTIRYNYGSNRLASGQQWAWNAASHADFLQVQVGPASTIEIYGNLMMGYTNALILGDSWGTASDVTIRDNFILFEGNGINSQSKGDVDGTYIIENNHIVMYKMDGVDGGGRSAIYFNDKGGNEDVTIRCNVFYGAQDTINVHLDSSIPVTSYDNIETGQTKSFDEISSSYVDLGYSMSNARDLSGIYTLREPVNGAGCVQGASFTSVDEHYNMVIQQQQ